MSLKGRRLVLRNNLLLLIGHLEETVPDWINGLGFRR